MHLYRTHTCGQLRAGDVGKTVRLSGWVHRKRDHGNLLFIDLRDHYGITQCVIDTSSPLFKALEAARPESVVTVTGPIVARAQLAAGMGPIEMHGTKASGKPAGTAGKMTRVGPLSSRPALAPESDRLVPRGESL